MKFFQNKRFVLAFQIAFLLIINGIFVYWNVVDDGYFPEVQAYDGSVAKKNTAYKVAENGSSAVISPEKWHSKLTLSIVDHLDSYHYRKVPLNDQLSAKVFEHYLSNLDSGRYYFLKSDVQAFETYRFSLDNDLKNGDLQSAYIIFNRYQKRVIERLEFVMGQIEKGLGSMNFDVDESIEIDRENLAWAENPAELDDTWRKRLKNEVLNLRLAGKPLDEIQALLDKRYHSQLNRVKQRNSEDAFHTYMNAFTQVYDPHTQYLSPRVSENFDILMKLSLEGIGAVLQRKNEYTRIVRLIPAGPADRSGHLKAGDRIVGVGQGVDGEVFNVIGWRLDDVVALIRGPKETVVQLEIIPVDAVDEQHTRQVKITRNTVKLEEQAAQKKVHDIKNGDSNCRIGVIEIPTFYVDFRAQQNREKDYRSTTRDVKRLLKELTADNVDGIIVDLRDNGGGALQEANSLTGLFIEEGPVVQVRGDNGRIRTLMDSDPKIVYDGPLLILINRMSASASEIFAGAIQDYNRGLVVGTQSFGKGTVQSLERLRQGQLKMTRGKFYRISGKSTQHKGVIPDIVFPEIYDKEKIGESALPEALAWDRISSVPYDPYSDFSPVVDQVRALHEDRVKKDPGFEYLLASISRMKETDEKKKISLKESVRKKEREDFESARLELENKRRALQGMVPLKSVSELDNADDLEDEIEPREDEKNTIDPILSETKNIICDFLSIAPAMSFQADLR